MHQMDVSKVFIILGLDILAEHRLFYLLHQGALLRLDFHFPLLHLKFLNLLILDYRRSLILAYRFLRLHPARDYFSPNMQERFALFAVYQLFE